MQTIASWVRSRGVRFTGATRPAGVARAATALTVSVALVGGCSSSGSGSRVSDHTATTSEVRQAHPTVPTGDANLDRELTEISRAVERIRGHRFRQPVNVQVLADAAFEQRVAETTTPARAALLRREQLLKALELIPADTDLVAVTDQLSRESILGFYDPHTRELVVRSTTALTPFTRSVIAHELTHALDDQQFGLARPALERADDERPFAFSALAEGSATFVENAYVKAMSATDRGRLQGEAEQFGAGMNLSGLPMSVNEIAASEYDLGLAFVRHLIAHGGRTRLDEAFRSPPISTAQLIHPERYDRGTRPRAVPSPPAEGTVIERGVLGEESLVEMLNAELAPARARSAAAGWAGDRYVLYDVPGAKTCFRADIRAGTPGQLATLRSALEAWGYGHADAAVSSPGGSIARVTACG